MPRPNRVTPSGRIVAVPDRGMFLGNRGVIHDGDGRIVRPWNVRRWLICVLEFKGRQRVVMTPNRYTELFFLDEATALAAGHRPCAECRRPAFLAFREAWAAGDGLDIPPAGIRVKTIDDRLHAERVGPARSKQTYQARLDDLPDGVMIRLEDSNQEAHLVHGSELLAWSPGGYREPRPRPAGTVVTVWTPPSTVAAIRAGYQPGLHPTVAVR